MNPVLHMEGGLACRLGQMVPGWAGWLPVGGSCKSCLWGCRMDKAVMGPKGRTRVGMSGGECERGTVGTTESLARSSEMS